MLCVASIFLFSLSGELIVPNNGQPLDLGLDDLGARINADVQRSLAPLENLGSRINQHVQQQVQQQLGPITDNNFQDDKWDPIADIDWSWATNLGDKITTDVEKGLKPVYEMEVRLNMENGVGGNTVVTYKPDGKTLIIRNSKPFECPGDISNQGTCSEDLKPFKIRKESDNCFLVTNRVLINGQICLSTDSVSVFGTFSEGLICRNGKGEKIEPMSLQKYEELCENSAKVADYKYVTNNKISPHKPADIQCSGSKPTICTFSNKKKPPGSKGYISNVNISF